MSIDPRALPPETLAAIAERDTDDSIYGPFRDPFQRAARAGDDRRALLAHAAYLAERLAEAEREIDRLVNKLQCPANARDDE